MHLLDCNLIVGCDSHVQSLVANFTSDSNIHAIGINSFQQYAEKFIVLDFESGELFSICNETYERPLPLVDPSRGKIGAKETSSTDLLVWFECLANRVASGVYEASPLAPMLQTNVLNLYPRKPIVDEESEFFTRAVTAGIEVTASVLYLVDVLQWSCKSHLYLV